MIAAWWPQAMIRIGFLINPIDGKSRDASGT
jgi:hypothetical protein